jgi:hypothetical protein
VRERRRVNTNANTMTTTFTTMLRRGSSLRVSSSSNCCKNDALALKALMGKRRSASSSISFPRNHEGGRKKQSSFVLKATNEDNENATLATGERDSASASASASTSSKKPQPHSPLLRQETQRRKKIQRRKAPSCTKCLKSKRIWQS